MTTGGLTNDTQAMMAFQSHKKSVGTAFLFWFFTGGLGGHRFYLGRTGSAIAQLILAILGWTLLLAAGAGLLFLIPLGIWLLVDAFLISGMVNRHNDALMQRLNATAPAKLSTVDELARYAALRDSGAISQDEYDQQKARLIGKPVAVAT